MLSLSTFTLSLKLVERRKEKGEKQHFHQCDGSENIFSYPGSQVIPDPDPTSKVISDPGQNQTF